MKKEKRLATGEKELKLDLNVSDVNKIEDYIQDLVKGADLKELNFLEDDLELNAETIESPINNAEFISVTNKNSIINEKEFLEIIGLKNGKLPANCGNYTKSLYSHFLQAKKENDEGYLSDIYEKAFTFKQNIKLVKELMENERFMKEWKANVGRTSPLSDIKSDGQIRRINIVRQLAE